MTPRKNPKTNRLSDHESALQKLVARFHHPLHPSGAKVGHQAAQSSVNWYRQLGDSRGQFFLGSLGLIVGQAFLEADGAGPGLGLQLQQAVGVLAVVEEDLFGGRQVEDAGRLRDWTQAVGCQGLAVVALQGHGIEAGWLSGLKTKATPRSGWVEVRSQRQNGARFPACLGTISPLSKCSSSVAALEARLEKHGGEAGWDAGSGAASGGERTSYII